MFFDEEAIEAATKEAIEIFGPMGNYEAKATNCILVESAKNGKLWYGDTVSAVNFLADKAYDLAKKIADDVIIRKFDTTTELCRASAAA